MKQALEYTRPGAIVPVTPETVKILVDALRLAIEQAERQEPVMAEYKFQPYGYWKDENGKTQLGTFPQAEQQETDGWITAGKHTAPLRIYSPQRQPLTEEQLKPIADEYRILFGGWVVDFARAIERAHGIGGEHE